MYSIIKTIKKEFLFLKISRLEGEIKHDRAWIKVLREQEKLSPKEEATLEYLRGRVSSMQYDYDNSCKELR